MRGKGSLWYIFMSPDRFLAYFIRQENLLDGLNLTASDFRTTAPAVSNLCCALTILGLSRAGRMDTEICGEVCLLVVERSAPEKFKALTQNCLACKSASPCYKQLLMFSVAAYHVKLLIILFATIEKTGQVYQNKIR